MGRGRRHPQPPGQRPGAARRTRHDPQSGRLPARCVARRLRPGDRRRGPDVGARPGRAPLVVPADRRDRDPNHRGRPRGFGCGPRPEPAVAAAYRRVPALGRPPRRRRAKPVEVHDHGRRRGRRTRRIRCPPGAPEPSRGRVGVATRDRSVDPARRHRRPAGLRRAAAEGTPGSAGSRAHPRRRRPADARPRARDARGLGRAGAQGRRDRTGSCGSARCIRASRVRDEHVRADRRPLAARRRAPDRGRLADRAGRRHPHPPARHAPRHPHRAGASHRRRVARSSPRRWRRPGHRGRRVNRP